MCNRSSSADPHGNGGIRSWAGRSRSQILLDRRAAGLDALRSCIIRLSKAVTETRSRYSRGPVRANHGDRSASVYNRIIKEMERLSLRATERLLKEAAKEEKPRSKRIRRKSVTKSS